LELVAISIVERCCYVGGSDRINIHPTTGTVTVSNNWTVNGIIVNTTNSLYPCWICGKVLANASAYSQHRGKSAYTCTKNGHG
jgi:predicted RNA-binding Zn-ribbon protein involved in translation (DUF1610 family)